MNYVKYTTKQGDRWDTIAHKAYGVATKFKEIMEANKGVPRTPVLKAGIELYIPIIEGAVINKSKLLPPWKQSEDTDNGFGVSQYEVVEESRINEDATPSRYSLINTNGRQVGSGSITPGTIGSITAPDAYVSFNGSNPQAVAVGETHDIVAPPAHVILKDTAGTVLDEVDAPSGEDKEVVAPDGVVTINGENPTNVKSGGSLDIEVTSGPTGFSKMPSKTGQTQSFVNGDDGFWQSGQDFFVLPIVNGVQQLNHFGSKWRFTGVTGGYYDRDTSQYKLADGTVTTRALSYPNSLRIDHDSKDWNNNVLMWWLDSSVNINRNYVDSISYANLFTLPDFVDNWKMPNFNELMSLWNTNQPNNVMSPVELLGNGLSFFMWSSTSLWYSTTQVFALGNDTSIGNPSKGASHVVIPCRITNLSELQLINI